MSILDTTERLHHGLDYHLQRHNLLTSNLTHIDTPNYRPLDLARGESFEEVLGAALAVTHPRHLTGARPATESEQFQVVPDEAALAGFDGNAVSVDREAVKIAANQLRYDTLSLLTSQELTGLDWAVSDGRRV